MSQKENNNKVVYKCKDVVIIQTKNGERYIRDNNWRYHYGILPNEPVITYHTFSSCYEDIELKPLDWPYIDISHTIFKNRPYIEIGCCGTLGDCYTVKIFEKNFKYATKEIRCVATPRINFDELGKILSYRDYVEFLKDNNITLTINK